MARAPGQKPSRFLLAGVVSFVWLPVIAVTILMGVSFGWRIPVAIAGLMGLSYGRAKLEVTRRRRGAQPISPRLLTTVSVVLGAAVGGLLFGGVGVIFGLFLGVVLGLPQQVSVKDKDGVLAPYDPRDRSQRARVHKTLGLFIAGCLVAALCLLLLASR